MRRKLRWDPCISHTGQEAEDFIACYFAQPDRKVVLIAGAGFDPRTTVVAKLLASVLGDRMRAFLLRENRPNPDHTLLERAEANIVELLKLIPAYEMKHIEIFGSDGAVIGGRNVVNELSKYPLSDVTDIVVDASAFSIGTSYPLVGYLVQCIERKRLTANLHLFVAHDPALDSQIKSTPSDTPSYVHGFKGRSTLDQAAGAAKLWLPQLASGRRGALNRLHTFVAPDDTCPILPFPASEPRLGDRLTVEFLTELEESWSVDSRDIVFAAEEDPLDLYRTILRLDELRRPVFAEAGGSMLILSPLGSKVMALGALMAALEMDLPVAYLESLSYELDASVPNSGSDDKTGLLHIWLEGDVYPQPRPPLSGQPTSIS
jgi:hypothetical protein